MRLLMITVLLGCLSIFPTKATTDAELHWEYEGIWDIRVQFTAAISHDGSQIAMAAYGDNQSADIHIYDLNSRAFLLRLNAASRIVTELAYSPTENLLASALFEPRAILWNPPNTEAVATFSRATISSNAVAFSPDGRYLAIGWSDGLIQLWDIQNREIVRELAASDYITELIFSPDGRYLFSAGERLLLWNTTNWNFTILGRPSFSSIAGAVFSPDGSRLISVYLDEAIQVYHIGSGESQERAASDVYAFPTPPTNPVITHDGRYLIFASLSRDVRSNDYEFRVYDLDSLRYVGYVEGNDAYRQLILSPTDNRRLYAVSLTGIHSWRITD